MVLVLLETLGVVGSIYYAQSGEKCWQTASDASPAPRKSCAPTNAHCGPAVRNNSIASASSIASTSARALERLLDDQKGPILQVATAIIMVSST